MIKLFLKRSMTSEKNENLKPRKSLANFLGQGKSRRKKIIFSFKILQASKVATKLKLQRSEEKY